MNTIALLTMVFLPATFVATFFSMGIFQFSGGAEGGLRVAGQWWIYPAVTVPLTVAVVVTWTTWLKWKGKRV
jgi:hypothetical protein